MEDFESLLEACRPALERDVRYRVWNQADADDILQETYITAFNKFDSLHDRSQFKFWILRIARNKVIDYFRSRKRNMEILTDSRILSLPLSSDRSRIPAVSETLAGLHKTDREILLLFYYEEMPQQDIALLLGLPLGTVKSRLHYAKEHFRSLYPHKSIMKGKNDMKKLPEILPAYTITADEKAPFSVKHEELPGVFIVPRLGEKITWGRYFSDKKLALTVESEVMENIILHGISGVVIRSSFDDQTENFYYASLNDTHIRWLGENYLDSSGTRHVVTFLDSEDFMSEWAFDENNNGVEINLTAKGLIERSGNTITTHGTYYRAQIDVVGSYTVNINEKIYDTICLMYIYKDGAATEQFIDKHGRTVLWRRFNADDWGRSHHDNALWTELLPENERLTINGITYVHWFDCVTNYIMK